MASAPVELSPEGFYCRAGGFHVDPWCPVTRAVVTHAHSDHAQPGSGHYLTAAAGGALLRERLGAQIAIETLEYGEPRRLGDATVSLHPAGHVLGSAQVRVDVGGQVWVISGDYKRAADPTCAPFEVVRCGTFVSEATFGLPIYRWTAPAGVLAEINGWWRRNQEHGRTSVLFGYPLGKCQRVLAGLDADLGPIAAHGAVLRMVAVYRAAGVPLPAVRPVEADGVGALRGRALVLAPPSALGSPWLRKFGALSTAFASGWMQIRGARRWRSIDRGFVLSDHADWDDLLATIAATGAAHIGLTHGYTAPLARYLREQGHAVTVYPTRFGDTDEGLAPQPAAVGTADRPECPEQGASGEDLFGME